MSGKKLWTWKITKNIYTFISITTCSSQFWHHKTALITYMSKKGVLNSVYAKNQSMLHVCRHSCPHNTLALVRFMAQRRSTRRGWYVFPAACCALAHWRSISRNTLSGRRNSIADRLISTLTTFSANGKTDSMSLANICHMHVKTTNASITVTMTTTIIIYNNIHLSFFLSSRRLQVKTSFTTALYSTATIFSFY